MGRLHSEQVMLTEMIIKKKLRLVIVDFIIIYMALQLVDKEGGESSICNS